MHVIRGTPGEVFADRWQATLIDALGQTHIIDTCNCPRCGALLYGLPHEEVRTWTRSEDVAISEAVRKVREAQRAIESVGEEKKPR
jgi:hypothetical protein